MLDIHLVEVGPRDGLQNEPVTIPTEIKVAYVDALSASGLREIEVSSFVAAGRIPQLADAEAVFAAIRRPSAVRFTALVPNTRGLERARTCKVDGIAVFTAASETFARRNINASIAESLERFQEVIRGSDVPVRGYVSTAWVCPFEGPIAPRDVVSVVRALLDLGCAEIALADTIGRATPDTVRQLLDAVLPHCPASQVAVHLHDTFGAAVANARAAEVMGIRRFDGSAGGFGGCPFAPGAPGNVATQALAQAFAGRTGVDGSRLDAAAALIRPLLSPTPASF